MSGPGKILGIDPGQVRIGLAVSDPDRKFAFPHDTYVRRSRDQDAAFFKDLIRSEDVTLVVVGLPVHLDGREGVKAAESRSFGRWLAEVSGCAVAFFDERFTTVEAENRLWDAGLTHRKRREKRDRVAAQILLQAYLDAGCPADQPPGALEG